MVYLAGTNVSRLSRKKTVKQVVVVVTFVINNSAKMLTFCHFLLQYYFVDKHNA